MTVHPQPTLILLRQTNKQMEDGIMASLAICQSFEGWLHH